MLLSAWLRDPVKRARLCVYLLLAGASCWAFIRIVRSFSILFEACHDGFMYYSLWFVLSHREVADIGLRQSIYLPHTWFFLTPLFIFGWPVGRVLLLLASAGSVVFIWWRLSRLAGLEGVKKWLFLAFFSGWLSTGLVAGLGNLALVCVALMVAAFPFSTASNGFFLAFSAMKQSLVFPLYFQLLLKRPKALIVPTIVFSVAGLAILFWCGLGLGDGVNVLKGWATNVSSWTAYDYTCLRRILVPFIHDKLVLTLTIWGIWFALFGLVFRLVKDPLTQLAAMLLLSLLPMYHFEYDMVAAAPALAVFLRRCRIVWPTLMTVSLATNLGSSAKPLAGTWFEPLGLFLTSAYYPLLILLFLGGLIYLELRHPIQCLSASPDGTDLETGPRESKNDFAQSPH